MHLFLLIVLFTISSISLAQVQQLKRIQNDPNNLNVHNAPSIYDDDGDDDVAEQPNKQQKRKCKPAMCSRIYRPVCALVDGIPLTAPTMCHLKDKERCLREIMDEGEIMPVFQFLHEGPCTDNDPNILKANKKVNKKRRPGVNKKKRPNTKQRN